MRGIPVKRVLVAVFLCAFVALAGCKKPPEKKAPRKAQEPVAEARQAVESPTLTLRRPATSKEAIEKIRERMPERPKGPITLPPATPSAEERPPERLPKAEGPAPLAKLPGVEGQKPQAPATDAEVASIAAPEVSMEAEPKPGEAEQVAYEPRLVTAKTNIDVVLDASGSMSAPFGVTTRSKFDLLRQALYDVIFEMVQQQADFPRNMAIRLMGSTTEASLNNCEDTELAVPMGEPNLDAIKAILDEVKAQGQSPLAYTLEQAVNDFPSGGIADRVIVLVADGADSCGGSPCEIAAGIAEGIVVHSIAFDVAPEDQKKLSCISKNADGQFFLARNEGELRNALDQAINSTVPYNLKLTATASGAPLPFRAIVYRAGTEDIVRKSDSLGTKLLSLAPGTYDILIEYVGSPEKRKPSKILKGVEVLSTTKVEQMVKFDLGRITLTALDNEGKPVRARFAITRGKGAEVAGVVETDPSPQTFFLPSGKYDISADLTESEADSFTVVESDVEIKLDTDNDIVFKFQKGSLAMKGFTTQQKDIPFLFQIYKSGTMQLIASGALPSVGGSVLLAPGNYDMMATGEDPMMAASPRTKVSGVMVRAAEPTEITILFEMGSLTLSAVDGKGNKLPAEFEIRDQKTRAVMAKVSSATGEPVTTALPPGTYDILTFSLKSILEPKPSVPKRNVVVTADKSAEEVITFVLGTLRLRGRNAKEQAIRTQFTIYRVGTDEVVAKAPPSSEWMVFDMAPGIYDALAVDMQEDKETRPMIWTRDIKIEDGKTISHEAIFTAGKLKVIGRGPNNKIIKVDFKVYQYGSDRELIIGETGNDWEIFEIEPGQYYIEASFHDEVEHQLLKKWINVSIGENEVVELVIRF
jgi:hypothetical protein